MISNRRVLRFLANEIKIAKNLEKLLYIRRAIYALESELSIYAILYLVNQLLYRASLILGFRVTDL